MQNKSSMHSLKLVAEIFLGSKNYSVSFLKQLL